MRQKAAGPSNRASKPVIDVPNLIAFSEDGSSSLTHGHTDSGGEQVQRWLPDAHVGKAFNTVFSEHMVNPGFPGAAGPSDLWQRRRSQEDCDRSCWSARLAYRGYRRIEGSRGLESLLLVIIPVMMGTGTRDFAFEFLPK